jgi:NAD(P)H dehydrogenase (quinone)
MIVVTGASGYIGSKAVALLLERGLPVTALGRDRERLRKAISPAVPLAIADYDDPPALDRAFASATNLLFIASDGFATDMIRHHANVIAAANRSAIAKVVFTSIIDLAESSPFYFAPVYRDAEQRLKTSRFASSIIRCGLYSDFILSHWLQEREISLPLADARIAPISRDDVASAAVHALLHETDPVWPLTGAESHSMAEIAMAMTRVTGATFTYRPCTPEDYVKRIAKETQPPWPEAFSSMCASIVQGRFAEPSTRFTEIMARPPERFEDFLARACKMSC